MEKSKLLKHSPNLEESVLFLDKKYKYIKLCFAVILAKLVQLALVVELKTVKLSKFYNLRRISPLRLSPNFPRGDLFELK